MRVEFYRQEAPDTVVGSVRWDGREPVLEHAEDGATGAAITRIFRATPVVTDDASLRTLSGHGDSVLEPGSLEWLRAAALTRAPTAGLTARFVTQVRPGEGYDPAANYRTFQEQVERIAVADEVATNDPG